ncbi:MAG: site-2 protease family protein [Candidatus Marinimicrobia bacterium]|jgi:Zn-dependent protease|nr:site-2 protease family protein [Candidatus Neomarinimicrobiota bacterium]MBT3618458.1 site-2 protease family protein [Candidatus Neomarinimicrobiota bacterium]MBT3828986.1 site-2 protease family protein [Candidatus Neomarinimicrobiota bacterium]MBT3997971.1 site-2 protease family protein [Candidatus Neomarinimicrobiota bacterium]MBT4280053.1 site-2 protease family protein [Candidatus Neomarinimicrobiota bacterium]
MGIASLDPSVQIILIPVILFSLSFHEFSHGWVAFRLGDPTAQQYGRLTLNPIAHLDMFGTLALYFMGFGWAKPVPVDVGKLNNPRRDATWVALAGPASNFLLALICGIGFSVLFRMMANGTEVPTVVMKVLQVGLFINISLGVFNFLPIPPLDGSRILEGFIPIEHRHIVHKMEHYGPMVLIGLIAFGWMTGFSVIWVIMGPIIGLLSSLFTAGLL